jgi:hypothetical protein
LPVEIIMIFLPKSTSHTRVFPPVPTLKFFTLCKILERTRPRGFKWLLTPPTPITVIVRGLLVFLAAVSLYQALFAALTLSHTAQMLLAGPASSTGIQLLFQQALAGTGLIAATLLIAAQRGCLSLLP